MSAFRSIAFVSLLMLAGWLNAQNAPISVIKDTVACPGSEITVSVHVTGFSSIGSLSLRMQYNSTALTFVAFENSAGFPGFFLNNAGGGILIAGGYSISPLGFTIQDDSLFFTVTFVYNGGSGNISWIDNGPSCEYTGSFPNYTVLNDNPFSKYYINGKVSSSLTANFISSTQLPSLNDTVYFTDLSDGTPVGWIWNFLPDSLAYVNGTDQNSQNPQVKFLSTGAFSASLKVSTNSCSDMLNRDDYLHVGTSGLWTGQISPEWGNPLNWHNGLTPDATTNVVIPSFATNWPEYPENFTVGMQCFNLTIESNGQMTVTGDLIIP
jgi:hypothetical protein